MTDPLTEIVGLLQPSALLSKVGEGAGAWALHRSEDGRPFYCAALDGACRLTADGHAPITLHKDDFVLIPSVVKFSITSIVPPPADQPETRPVELRPGLVRFGNPALAIDVRLLVGYCTFGSPDTALLLSLLPKIVHVESEPRLSTIVQLVNEESRASRPGRAVILARLVEVLMIEALRSTSGSAAHPGLLRGLTDDRLATALRRMHEHPTRPWTVVELARAAGLSRSSFFDRFRRAVGVAPMEYLLQWRMALAKDFLRRREGTVAQAAARVGYSSASTFSVAFARHVGIPPAAYSRGQIVCDAPLPTPAASGLQAAVEP